MATADLQGLRKAPWSSKGVPAETLAQRTCVCQRAVALAVPLAVMELRENGLGFAGRHRIRPVLRCQACESTIRCISVYNDTLAGQVGWG